MTDEIVLRLFGTPGELALAVLAVLAALLLGATLSDLRRQRIPNALVFGGSLLALLLHTILPAGDGFISALPGGLGFTGSLKGLAIGLFAMLPLYALRGMGAGDVKLMAMVGAFLGPQEIWWALLFTLIAGGLLAVATLLHRALAGAVLQNLKLIFWDLLFAVGTLGGRFRPPPGNVTAAVLPYAIAIAFGSLAAAIWRAPQFGLF